MEYLDAKGIDVLDVSDSDDALLSPDDEEFEEDAPDPGKEDLSVPEGTTTDDPVRMYLKDRPDPAFERGRGGRAGRKK